MCTTLLSDIWKIKVKIFTIQYLEKRQLYSRVQLQLVENTALRRRRLENNLDLVVSSLLHWLAACRQYEYDG